MVAKRPRKTSSSRRKASRRTNRRSSSKSCNGPVKTRGGGWRDHHAEWTRDKRIITHVKSERIERLVRPGRRVKMATKSPTEYFSVVVTTMSKSGKSPYDYSFTGCIDKNNPRTNMYKKGDKVKFKGYNIIRLGMMKR